MPQDVCPLLLNGYNTLASLLIRTLAWTHVKAIFIVAVTNNYKFVSGIQGSRLHTNGHR